MPLPFGLPFRPRTRAVGANFPPRPRRGLHIMRNTAALPRGAKPVRGRRFP